MLYSKPNSLTMKAFPKEQRVIKSIDNMYFFCMGHFMMFSDKDIGFNILNAQKITLDTVSGLARTFDRSWGT